MKKLLLILLLFSIEAITQEIQLQYVTVSLMIQNNNLMLSETRNVYNDIETCNKALYQKFKEDRKRDPKSNLVYRNGERYHFRDDNFMEIYSENNAPELGIYMKTLTYCSPLFKD